MIAEFASETTPVYKCPVCKWIFAPADEMVAGLLLKFLRTVEEVRTTS